MNYLKPILSKYKKEVVLAPLFKLLEAVFELFVPLVMANIIDVGIPENNMGYILKMGLILLLLAAVGLTVSITAQFFAAKAAVGASAELRQKVFDHIMALDFSSVDKATTSTLITRMTSDINQVQQGINMILRLFLRSPVIVFGAMIMAFTIDVKSALIFVVAIPLMALVVYWVTMKTLPMNKKVQGQLDRVLGITRENLTGVRVIRAFHLEKSEKERFNENNQELASMQVRVGRISAIMNPVTYIIVNGAIIYLIYTGAIQVNLGILTQGQVVALVNYMNQILVELLKLANLFMIISRFIACTGRVGDVLAIPVGMDASREEGDRPGTKDEAPATADPGDGYLVFDDVSLTYEGAGSATLEHINLKVQKGQTIGVIGGTGSGKSSLVNLIPRFYDITEGSLRLEGQELKEMDPEALRKRIGMVPQKAVLFRGTIRSNLKWGNPDADDAAMWEALRLAQAEEIVRDKSGQLDATVAQGGKNFSGGQKQRLTIARALVRKPEILILDDSASALDYLTDRRLREAIASIKGITTFIVSQRASSVMNADQILVLDDGEPAGLGTHEELLKTCEVYREIYESQFEKGGETDELAE